MVFFVVFVLAILNGITLQASEGAGLTIPEGVLIRSGLDTHFVAHFALFIALVLLWTVSWGKILHKLCWLPAIAGQIIGGIILGPSFLDIRTWALFSEPFRIIDHATGTLYTLASSDLFIFFILLISASLTVSYLMWIAGHETDIKDIAKVGIPAIVAGFFGAIFPVICAIIAIHFFLLHYFNYAQSMAIGLILSATSVSIPVAMLFSRNKMHLKSSKATLGAAIIDDILAVIFLSIFFISLQAGMFGSLSSLALSLTHSTSISEAISYMLISFVGIFFVGYFVVPPIIRWLQAKSRNYLIPAVANGIMLVYFAFAELVGQLAGITGAYFAGLFHRIADKDHHAEKVISPFANTILLPLFLGSIGLQIDISILSMHEWGIVIFLLTIAIVSKIGACFMAAWIGNMFCKKAERWSWIESYLFGSSMVARGEVGLVIATILHGSGIINSDQYVIAVVVIILTTIVAPIMLAIGFSWQDRMKSLQGNVPLMMNIGFFKHVGSAQMFNIIVGEIEKKYNCKISVQFSEGRRIVSLDGEDVKVVFSPQRGIFFEGNKEKITTIIAMVKRAISQDLEKLSTAALQG